ncbi:MAG: FAD-binding oxidoreductase [Nitrospinota bacterium]|nr:MAG: FAD-binding oxidoreductase [Nitrospinota bacterium]
MIPKSADVVIIGAGAIGCSIAYHLARRGQTDVVVLERDLIGSGTTSKAAGGIRAQFGTETEVRFSLESLDFFRRFEEEMGTSCYLRQVGYLFLLNDERDLERFRQQVAMQQRLGVDVQIISPQEARELVPQLAIEDLLAAVYCPTDGYAGTNEVVMGYARKAREKGVRILEQTEVVDILVHGERVAGVQTTRGTIATPLVVNAAGPWAGLIGKMLGQELPLLPRRRHIFFTEPFPDFVHPSPLVIDRTSGFYCRAEGPGVLMSPGDAEAVPLSYHVGIDWSKAEETAQKATRRVPVLQRAGIMSGWAGLRPLTPDEHAIIDYLPGVEGVLCAIGFCGHGFQHSPAAGRVVAEMILDGQPSLDLSLFRLSRFQNREITQQGRAPEPEGNRMR